MNDLLSQDNTQPLFDENKDYFTDLVGEGKKFKTEQDLAKSKVRSDLYIQDILRQKDELSDAYADLKKQYDARASIEEVMDQIDSRYQSRELPKKADIQPHQNPSIDYDKLSEQFENWSSQREQRKTEDQNLNESKRMLKEHLGENYLQVVRDRIDEMQLSQDDVNFFARRNPKTLARVLGLEQQQQPQNLFQSPPQNQRRNDNFKPAVQKRTWSYYQALKKENPRIMLDPKIAVQMHNDHIEQGSGFEDGDFHQNRQQ